MEEEVKLAGEVVAAQNLRLIDNDELLDIQARSTANSPKFGSRRLLVQPENEGQKCDICGKPWHPLNLCKDYINRCLQGNHPEDRAYGVKNALQYHERKEK